LLWLGETSGGNKPPTTPEEENRMNSSPCMKSGLAFFLVAAIAFGPSPSLWAGDKADPLDGKTFVGEIGEKGKTEGEYEETMSFKGGEMVSSACSTLGFDRFAYTATGNGGVIEFVAEATNPTEGTLRWEGVVKGDTLRATSVWRKPGAPLEETWLTAKLQE